MLAYGAVSQDESVVQGVFRSFPLKACTGLSGVIICYVVHCNTLPYIISTSGVLCRFLGANLNRLYTEEALQTTLQPDPPYEYTLIAPLMHAVRDCTEFLDIHSTSAPTPPMAFHMLGDAAFEYALSFPVDFTLEDETGGSRGTSVAYAAQVGLGALAVLWSQVHFPD